MTLFDECITALGDNAKILSKQETIDIFNQFTGVFPMTQWGRVDWEMVNNSTKLNLANSEVIGLLKGLDTSVFILWDEASLPSIKTDLKKAIEAIEDITAVSFDTWLFNPYSKYVIELHHDDGITVGML